MRILLDTHIFLWMIADRGRVGEKLVEILSEPENEIIFSSVVSWEITTKRSSGKLAFSGSPIKVARKLGLAQLAITPEHCEIAGELALHHKDPFDRLLIAQAQAEGLVLATGDRQLGKYGVPILRNV